MTSCERLMAAAIGGIPDRKPVICWPTSCPDSDGTFLECADLAALSTAEPARLRLAKVLNPFGRALKLEVPLDDELAEDPAKGERTLDSLVAKTKQEMESALQMGADGIFYMLYGARGLHTTPMEYGGHYLERDRELLAGIENATFNMIFVVGENDAYLDFVSDLPAHAFGWDCLATGVDVNAMRQMRPCGLATNSPDADIELRFGTETLAANLEAELQTSHV